MKWLALMLSFFKKKILIVYLFISQTLTETAKECKKLDISFPAINYTKTDKDFYVFKGLKKAPTVIHIPLFNIANCGRL
jgi:hypothetical protein